MWMAPHYFLGFIKFNFLLLTRAWESLTRGITMGKLEVILHTYLGIFVWLFWRCIELTLRMQFGLDKLGLTPVHKIEEQGSSVCLAPKTYYDEIRRKNILPMRTRIMRFHPGNSYSTGKGFVEFVNGQRVAADSIIFATGYRTTFPFLSEELADRVMDRTSCRIRLYRNMLSPTTPGLLFNGFGDSSLLTPLVSEFCSVWLLQYTTKQLKTPCPAAMVHQSRNEFAASVGLKKVGGSGVGGSGYASPFRLVEQLVEDMDPERRVKVWRMQEMYKLFLPVDIANYKRVLDEIRQGEGTSRGREF